MHNGTDKTYEDYCTDIFFDEAIKWMKQCQQKKVPFFTFIPTNTPHVPEVVAREYSAPYKGTFKGKKIPDVFYGMISNIDDNIAKLEKFLLESGLKENTIVIFTSDNGTQNRNAQALFNDGMRGKKGTMYEGGHRVPFFIRWPQGQLAHGQESDQLTTVQDLLPTLIQFCNLKGENSLFDGLSLNALMQDPNKQLPDRIKIIQFGHQCHKWASTVIMYKKWRLVGDKNLYDLKKDPHQTENVARQYPELVKKLTDHYEAWYSQAKKEFDKKRFIIIGHPDALSQTLYASDWQGDYCDNRSGLIKARGNGYFDIKVHQKGKYEIELRRWPEESLKSLSEPFEKNKVKGAIPITKSRLRIADHDTIMQLDKNAKLAKFTLTLNSGVEKLQAEFLDANGGVLCGALYVKISFLK